MTTVKVGAKKALELIHTVVQQRGEDWVYPDTGACRYVYHPAAAWWNDDILSEGEQAMLDYFGEDDDQPACLVGALLFTLDPAFLPWMDAHNDNSVYGIMGDDLTGFDVPIGETTYHFTAKAIKAMSVAQSAQDVGKPWGMAESLAIAYFEEG